MSEYNAVQDQLDKWIQQSKTLAHKIELACKWLNYHDADYAKLSTKQIIKDINRPSVKSPKPKHRK